MISIETRRELALTLAGRYAAARKTAKTRILDEFIATTGYARKYAITLLRELHEPAGSLPRKRPRWYGDDVRDALLIAWAAANCICAKRLVPFLAELVPTLERHGHLALTGETREKLLAISPATVDRLLEEVRRGERQRGLTTTRRGPLLKHQVPVRTFSDWEDATPGFMEADLVAHCGGSASGSFLQTLVLTDVSTGWTECLALLYRSEQEVIQALTKARALLPFPLLGLDTDNGSEFLNVGLLDYCHRERITFTRCRPYRKNDQCHVEQKNGTVVRQLVGYDRFEGVPAWRRMTQLYQQLRLYINFFQPSMKLRSKKRDGAKVSRKYDAAQTPYQRLLPSHVLPETVRERLGGLSATLDPIAMLQQIGQQQDALWEHAWERRAPGANRYHPRRPRRTARARLASRATTGQRLGANSAPAATVESAPSAPPVPALVGERQKRRYRKSGKPRVPHTWRTRPDPFESVNDQLRSWLRAEPEATAKSLFDELQRRYPGQFPDCQLRCLQTRVKGWRVEVMRALHDEWLATDRLLAEIGGHSAAAPIQAAKPGSCGGVAAL